MRTVDKVLGTWQEWGLQLTEPPVVLSSLDQGLTNQSFVVSSSGRQWVLRLNAPNAESLGIDRNHEADILEVTSKAGLSPDNYYNNPERGFLVSEYLPAWQPDRSNSDWLRELAAVMKRIHQQVVPDVPAVNYITYSEQYIARLKAGLGKLPDAITLLREQELPFISDFQQTLATPQLCHHDPSQNHWRLQRDGLCLIDWEYAAFRDPACDLYMVCESWQLDSREQEQLLNFYGDISEKRLCDARRVCRYIDALWFEIQKIKVGEPQL